MFDTTLGKLQLAILELGHLIDEEDRRIRDERQRQRRARASDKWTLLLDDDTIDAGGVEAHTAAPELETA